MTLLSILRAIFQNCESKCRDKNRNNCLSKRDAFATIQFNCAVARFEQIDELREQIKEFSSSEIPLLFIERFCAGAIADILLGRYPINIGEAFVLGLVCLGINDLAQINFKLGTSGILVKGTIIKGSRIDDTEAIADFIFDSLTASNLIYTNGTNKIFPGPELKIKELFS